MNDNFNEQQRGHITATDVAKILGLSKYGTALTVYNSKIDGRPAIEDNEAMQRGRLYEPWILREIGGESFDDDWMVHTTLPLLGFHADGRDPINNRIHEIKTVGKFRDWSEWGEIGTDQIPIDYWCQTRHQAIVSATHGYDGVVVTAAFLSCRDDEAVRYAKEGNFSKAVAKIETYYAPPAKDGDVELVDTLRSFWYDNVLPGSPPFELSVGDAPSGYPLRDHYREINAESDADLRVALSDLRAAALVEKAGKEDVAALREKVNSLLNERKARRATGCGAKMWYSVPSRVDNKALIAELSSMIPGFQDVDMERLTKKHTKASGEGSWTLKWD